MVDRGKWAMFDPSSDAVIQVRNFPKGGFVNGIPRSCGSLVAIAGGKDVGVWDFSDVQNPVSVAKYSFPDMVEAVSFWNGRAVVPARTAGVLIPNVSTKP